jgi:hypothetical protein
MLDMQPEVMQEGDDKLIVKFFLGSVEIPFKSEQEGRPIFESRPYVTIITPGSRDSLTVPVNDVHKRRFPAAWKRFEGSQEAHDEIHGMPLKEWPMVTRAQAEEMAFLNVFTVEQLADLADTHGQKMMNFHDLKRKAQAFVEAAKDGAFVQRITAENQKLQDQITALQTQLQEQAQAFAKFQAQVGGGDVVSSGGASNRRK